MKVSSDVGAAQAAVAGFAEVETGGAGQQVSLGSSNVRGMTAGVKLSNQLLSDISALVAGVKSEADRVTALASQIEARDKHDASGLRQKK